MDGDGGIELIDLFVTVAGRDAVESAGFGEYVADAVAVEAVVDLEDGELVALDELAALAVGGALGFRGREDGGGPAVGRGFVLFGEKGGLVGQDEVAAVVCGGLEGGGGGHPGDHDAADFVVRTAGEESAVWPHHVGDAEAFFDGEEDVAGVGHGKAPCRKWQEPR